MKRVVEGGYFGPQLVVRGELRGSAPMQIDGAFDGEIELDSDLAIGTTGKVHAPVRALSVEVEGELRGPVVAMDAVAVRADGRLIGDVRAKTVAIDDGGALLGGIEMDFDLPEDLDELDGLGGLR